MSKPEDTPIIELANATDNANFTFGERRELMPLDIDGRLVLVPATPEWIAERDAKPKGDTYTVTVIDREAGTITVK